MLNHNFNSNPFKYCFLSEFYFILVCFFFGNKVIRKETRETPKRSLLEMLHKQFSPTPKHEHVYKRLTT